jgi:tetratricopeptide (TPR) repeat protein
MGGGKMKKCISLVIVLACVFAICAAPAWAQFTGTVKGVAKDESGKPIDGATVELSSPETGRKVALKTNSKGEYFSIGIPAGTYRFTLMKDGKVLDTVDRVPVVAGDERKVDFDLQKEKSQAAQQAGVSEEQQKKVAEVQKQNETIKGLNAQLAQARQLEAAGEASQGQARQLESAGSHDQAQAKQAEAASSFDQAITILQQATQADPNQDVTWANLGEIQAKAKKYPEAIESYQKAIALKPTSGPYHSGLADAYAKSGQTEKAVQEWATAAQNDPTNAGSYYFNEGAVLTNTGKIDEAIAAFDKALQADPTRADAYYWKGVDLMGKATTKGDKMVAPEGTAEAFNKYLELAPTGKYADPAKQMLASIGASVETSYGKTKTPAKKKP